MESGPGIFAGTVFALSGAALLVWTGVRVCVGAPVVQGPRPPLPLVLALLFGTASVAVGGWLLAAV